MTPGKKQLINHTKIQYQMTYGQSARIIPIIEL